ncbi:hypothetical protein [Rhodopseudomonas palustris]|nr:hypothetical protein [Rhodopseudomonas palustris]
MAMTFAQMRTSTRTVGSKACATFAASSDILQPEMSAAVPAAVACAIVG